MLQNAGDKTPRHSTVINIRRFVLVSCIWQWLKEIQRQLWETTGISFASYSHCVSVTLLLFTVKERIFHP